MESFKSFYRRLQEEKLLKPTDGRASSDGEIATEEERTEDNALLKERDGKTNDVLSDGKVTDNAIISTEEKKSECCTVANPLLDEYPTGPINSPMDNRVENVSAKDIGGGFGYGVVVSPSCGMLPFSVKKPITMEINPHGIVRYELPWNEERILEEIAKRIGTKDNSLNDKILGMVTYILGLPRKNREICMEYLNNFTDYNLFWKFSEQLEKMEKNDPFGFSSRKGLKRKLDGIGHKPKITDGNEKDSVVSREFYNTLKEMNGGYTLGEVRTILGVIPVVSVPTVNYFRPTLNDLIRIYDEGETRHRELPLKVVMEVCRNQSDLNSVKESLYSDVKMSLNDNKPFPQASPQNFERFTNEFGKDLGEILYEFVNEEDGSWNRITDRGVFIGYNDTGKFNSVDIRKCSIPTCEDMAGILCRARRFNDKYHCGDTIPVSLLKTCLKNCIRKKRD